MENEVNKGKKKIYIVTTIWVLIFLMVGGILITYCLNNNKKTEEKEDNSIESQERVSTKTTDLISFKDTGTYQIKLGNKIVDVTISDDTRYIDEHRKITIDGKDINSIHSLFGPKDEMYVINNEIVMIAKKLSSGTEKKLYFYDQDLNNINVELQFEKDYNMNIINIKEIKDNKLIIETVNGHLAHNKAYHPNELCVNKNVTAIKDQFGEATYEVEYLGNGEFSQPKITEESKKISEIEECKKYIKEYNIDLSKFVDHHPYLDYTSSTLNEFKFNLNSDNTVEITANWNEYYKCRSSISIPDKTIVYKVTNLSGIVKDVFVSGLFGPSCGDETIFYLMEDGTVEYTPLIHFITNNDLNDITALKSYGKIDNVEGVEELTFAWADLNGRIIGIKKDMTFYDLSHILYNNYGNLYK